MTPNGLANKMYYRPVVSVYHLLDGIPTGMDNRGQGGIWTLYKVLELLMIKMVPKALRVRNKG